jgi:Flp pilus assembly protein TadB
MIMTISVQQAQAEEEKEDVGGRRVGSREQQRESHQGRLVQRSASGRCRHERRLQRQAESGDGHNQRGGEQKRESVSELLCLLLLLAAVLDWCLPNTSSSWTFWSTS